MVSCGNHAWCLRCPNTWECVLNSLTPTILKTVVDDESVSDGIMTKVVLVSFKINKSIP